MKYGFISLVLLFINLSLHAQLQVDAGNDTIICIDLYGIDTTQIGGQPTATGSIGPYQYIWSAKYSIGSNTYYASTFLDDTTKANPEIVNDPVGNHMKFYLKVTDSNDQTGFDTIHVRFSRYAYTLVDYVANINSGDTIMLGNNIGGGIKPLRYAWYPNYNISDTSIHNPMAWPDTSVDYSVYAIDSIGCQSATDTFEAYVNPVGIELPKSEKIPSSVFPNPIMRARS